MSDILSDLSPSLPVSTGDTKHARSILRACEYCRKHKVRCSAANDGTPAAILGQCQRCADARRECIFTAPSRTRVKRTDVRIRELERNVRMLKDLLRSTNSTDPLQNEESNLISEAGKDGMLEVEKTYVDFEPFDWETGRASKRIKRFVKPGGSLEPMPVDGDIDRNVHQPRDSQSHSGKVVSTPDLGFLDVIDSGLLSNDKATELFNQYVDDMVPQRPIVVFSPGTEVDSLRAQKPTLFLAVLAAAASGTLDRELGKALNERIIQKFADQVMVRGEKSLELIQALLITANWSYSPDTFDKLNFYQHLHLAATMAMDLGLGEGNLTNMKTNKMRQTLENGRDGHQNPTIDHDIIENRRTLLACYLCCSSVSLGLHRPNMFPFTAYMDESLKVLETSPSAAVTDSRLVAWVKLQRILDLSATALGLDNPSGEISLADRQTQLTLQNCSKQLEGWKKRHTTPPIMNDTLSINHLYFTCILHELALYPDYVPDDFKPPYVIGNVRPVAALQESASLTSTHISSIITCLSSAHAIMDTFLRMTTLELRCSPCIVYARMGYAAVLVLKIFISASSIDGALNGVLDPDLTNVQMYLTELEDKLKETAGGGGGQCHRLAENFLSIMTSLREWYRKYQQQNTNPTTRERHRRGELSKEEDSNNNQTELIIEPLRHMTMPSSSSASDPPPNDDYENSSAPRRRTATTTATKGLKASNSKDGNAAQGSDDINREPQDDRDRNRGAFPFDDQFLYHNNIFDFSSMDFSFPPSPPPPPPQSIDQLDSAAAAAVAGTNVNANANELLLTDGNGTYVGPDVGVGNGAGEWTMDHGFLHTVDLNSHCGGGDGKGEDGLLMWERADGWLC